MPLYMELYGTFIRLKQAFNVEIDQKGFPLQLLLHKSGKNQALEQQFLEYIRHRNILLHCRSINRSARRKFLSRPGDRTKLPARSKILQKHLKIRLHKAILTHSVIVVSIYYISFFARPYRIFYRLYCTRVLDYLNVSGFVLLD